MPPEEFLCVRCARYMRTCCQTCEVYVSPGDVQRIADHTGRADFYEFRVPDNPEYLHNEDDPLWQTATFRADGTRRVLRRRPEGDCTFLGPHGCTLPLDVRPLVCRLYPYDYTEQGIRPQLARGCPTHLLRPGQGLIEALGMNLADAERWHRQLYAEIRQEPHLAADAGGAQAAVEAAVEAVVEVAVEAAARPAARPPVGAASVPTIPPDDPPQPGTIRSTPLAGDDPLPQSAAALAAAQPATSTWTDGVAVACLASDAVPDVPELLRTPQAVPPTVPPVEKRPS